MELVPHLQHVVATYGLSRGLRDRRVGKRRNSDARRDRAGHRRDLCRSGTLKIYWVIGAAAAGAIIGDNCGYWVGRELGFPLVYRFRP